MPNSPWIEVPDELVIGDRGNPVGQPVLCVVPAEAGAPIGSLFCSWWTKLAQIETAQRDAGHMWEGFHEPPRAVLADVVVRMPSRVTCSLR